MAKDENKPVTYSPAFAFIYIFNLVVGVGALSLPVAFNSAGLLLGTILLIVLAGMSYMTATFMIEAMAIANAYSKYLTRRNTTAEKPSIQQGGFDYQPDNEREMQKELNDEKAPLVPPILEEEDSGRWLSGNDDNDDGSISTLGSSVIPSGDYEIEEKFEMGKMANLFYHPVGIVLYYICICLYLYGDLAIYAVAIPKSLVTVTCESSINFVNATNDSDDGVYCDSGNFNASSICFKNVTNQQAYYIFLSIFALILCPWTFFNLTRSKYLQLLTTIMRNIAFTLMIAIAIAQLAQGSKAEPLPRVADFKGFPVLFGVSIYSFMCQHSLPGMITPMSKKRGVFAMVGVDFGMILAFYLLLAFTGVFRFGTLCDLYTLNFFQPFDSLSSVSERTLSVLGYYLALFPVFTLSTNFPIISITLRENLKSLGELLLKLTVGKTKFPWLVDKLLFPILALIPPLAIAYGTSQVELLVSITGSFPGIGVQYVIPVTLAFAGKYIITRKLNIKYENKYKSPFSYIAFLVFVLLWTGISVILIIVDDIIKIVNHEFL